ncbi:hypothetical protein ACXR6G_06495 [Ancylomarina sp. YFZ004]
MKYSRNQIKKAGRIFKEKLEATETDILLAEDILTYWRTIHGKLIEEFQKDINEKVIEIDNTAFIAKRLKRSPSIIKKLKRLNNLQLSTMQDIAGIRVVVSSLSKVRKLVKSLKSGAFEEQFKHEDDYLASPKRSGYRGIHLIYKFKNEDIPELHGLLIEVQIRTSKQHAWATSVETMGTYLNSHLKFNEGKPKWLNYFALTSSAFAYIEKTNLVPQYSELSEFETYKRAIYEYNYNKIEESLEAYSVVSDIICDKKNSDKNYHLIILDVIKKKITISSFSIPELEKANEYYTSLEREFQNDDNMQIVLVSTVNVKELREAYPNYFLDTKEFIKNMHTIKRRYNKIKKSA